MSQRQFSLLELMIVLLIVGVLVMVVVPNYFNNEHVAKVTVTKQKINEIQKSMLRFAVDVDLLHGEQCEARLEDMKHYGLWPLMQWEHPDSQHVDYRTLYPQTYDEEYKIGRRRDAYLLSESEMLVDANITIPIIRDGFGNPIVLASPVWKADESDKLECLKHMVIVSPGSDGKISVLWSTGKTFNPSTLRVDPACVEDDIVMPLFPMYRGTAQ